MNPNALLSSFLHTQENRLFTLHSPVPEAGLLVDHFHGTENLSTPFAFQLKLISQRADLAPKDFLGKPMGIALKTASGGERSFHGHVTRFRHTGSDGGFATFEATLGPWTEFLTHRVNCKLFHRKNVIAIAREVFGDYGHLARHQFQVKEAEYPELTMTVQYHESDWQFISRLLEAHGIYYFFTFEKDGHVLVLGDESRAAPPVPEGEQLAYNSIPGAAREDTIDSWTLGEALAATDFTTTSFDFKNPSYHMANRHHTSRPPALPAMEHYQPVGAYGFKDFEDGKRLAKLRMEQLEQPSETYQGTSNVRTLTCGHSFELRDHYRKSADIHDRLFLVLSVSHQGSNNYLNQSAGSDYHNSFACAPRAVPFRPPRITPLPVAQGPQTATVVGAPGEEIYCDRHGRVLIQFHWDRLGQFNDASSAWVRVGSPMAGSRFGFIALPRIGQEVIVEFLDGNPDRPIIVGAVYNELVPPPWELPEHRTQSGILTRSSKDGQVDNANALRFEDKKGHEEVWLHAEKDQRIEVEHDESHTVGHDRSKQIDNDERNFIGGHQSLTVEKSQTIHVNRTKDETVSLASTEQVGAGKTLTVGAAYAITVIGGKSESVGLASLEQVGAMKNTFVGSNYNIEVVDQLSISVGASSLIMNQDGTITLSGKQINILAEGPLKLVGKDIENN